MKIHLQYNWWKYLLLLILTIFFWTNIFSAMALPDQDRRVNILYVGENLDSEGLQAQLAQVLPTITQQPVESLRVQTEQLPTGNYAGHLTARSFDYDIILVEETYYRENMGQNLFVRLTDELTACFPAATAYCEPTEDGTLTFGFVACQQGTENRLSGFYAGEQTCYLFISPHSVNFDTLNENGEAGNDAALKITQYLLEETP